MLSSLDATRNAIVAHITGKRNEATTCVFVNDV